MYCYVVTTNFRASQQKKKLTIQKIKIHKNETVWDPKRDFFSPKARLNFEVYGQEDKITPEAGEKRAPFYQKRGISQRSYGHWPQRGFPKRPRLATRGTRERGIKILKKIATQYMDAPLEKCQRQGVREGGGTVKVPQILSTYLVCEWLPIVCIRTKNQFCSPMSQFREFRPRIYMITQVVFL